MIDDEERRKVRKKSDRGENEKEWGGGRKSRGSFTLFGSEWVRLQRILCIYGHNMYGVVYRGTFIQGIRYENKGVNLYEL